MQQLTEIEPSPPHQAPGRFDNTVVRLAPTRGFSRMLAPRELWRYRDLARQFVVRDITVRYRQTALGAAWAIIQPVAIMIVFTIFFGNLAHISSEGVPYALFALAGLVPWTFFANTLTVGSDSLVNYSQLVSKVYFPRIFLPFAVIGAGLLDFTVSFTILVIVVLVDGRVPPVAVVAVPLLLLIEITAVLGATAALSAINVRYRDVRYAIPFTVQLWLFATPIAYSSTLLHEPWRTISAINPMVGVVEGFRWAMLGNIPAPWSLIGVSAASAVLFLLVGLAYFGRVERGFADIV